MGRKRLIEEAELIKYIDRYLYEELNGVPDKLTAANISRYLKSNDFNIEPRIISRDKVAMAHIRALQESYESANPSVKPVVFKPLDIDAFLKTNSSPQAMRRALVERDQYYSDVADGVALITQKMKKLEADLNTVQEELTAVKEELKAERERITSYKVENKQLSANNQALKKTIDTYIKPAIAEELLKRDGYLSSSTETLVTSEDFDEKIISADTKIENPLMQEMLDAFED